MNPVYILYIDVCNVDINNYYIYPIDLNYNVYIMLISLGRN